MPYKRESKARRRKTKLKQGLINTTTEAHNQSPSQIHSGRRKPRDPGSWFASFLKSTKQKQLYGRRGGRKRGGKDSNFEGYRKRDGNKRSNSSVKKKPPKKDVFELGHGALDAKQESANDEDQASLRRRKGESARDYTLRMRKENAKAILEERKKNTKTNTKLKRKRFLEAQKLRKKNNKKRKRQRKGDSSEDEDNIYEKIKFGERVEDIPNLRRHPPAPGRKKKKVVTLLDDDNAGLDIGDRKSYSQMEELAKRVNTSYFARQLD